MEWAEHQQELGLVSFCAGGAFKGSLFRILPSCPADLVVHGIPAFFLCLPDLSLHPAYCVSVIQPALCFPRHSADHHFWPLLTSESAWHSLSSLLSRSLTAQHVFIAWYLFNHWCCGQLQLAAFAVQADGAVVFGGHTSILGKCLSSIPAL